MSTVESRPPLADDLGNRLEFETLLAEVSSRFISLPPGEVDREIEEALSRFCGLLGIDLAVLWQWSHSAPDIIAATHVHYAQEGPRPSEPLSQEHFPWARQQVLAGRLFAFTSLDDLPPEAAVDRESCRLFGFKSVVCLPLSVGGDAVGALALSALNAPRDWPDVLVHRLQLVAQVFGNALARKHHELALQESEARLSLAADSAEAGLWTLDYRAGVFWVTERARAIFGYLPGEVIDLARLEASVHPDDRDLVRGAVERSARAGEPVDLEYRILLPGDGRVRWVASRGRPHFDATGKPDRLTGISIDITDRRLAEDARRRSEARLESGADLAGLAFYEVDFSERATFLDDRVRTIWGVPPEREHGLEPGAFWMEHLHPDDRQRVLDAREQLNNGGLERLEIEYRFLHPTAGERWIHHLARVARRDATGHAVQTFGAFRDITERRRADEALRQSFAEIERLKDRLQAESEYLKAEVRVTQAQGELTGESAAIQKVLRLTEQVAPTDSSVLLRGETGTGKELVAQAIHRLGPRRSHVMVKVNCAALPSGLVESELFGREKGAFTGALTRQVGRFEIADGSTIFLDEIGELSLDLQAKLLRVLESGEFERLGSPRTIKVDVRLIAATNRDLADAIKQGRFREDLYYRLNVFPIRVPPLRERAEDIPLLVWTFLRELNSRMGKKITQVPRKTMEALQRHPWPGNVRELRNVIEHGAIVTTGDTLRVPMLDDEAPPAAAPSKTLAEAERDIILRTLERTGWHVKGPKGAAAELGLNPATLYSGMKKLGIRPRRQRDDDPA